MTELQGLPVLNDAEYGNPMWDDLKFPLSRDKQGQNSKPDYDFVNMGLLFPQNNPAEIVYMTTQLEHAWVQESQLRPHIHYIQDEAEEPVFKLDYRWYENGGDPTISFTTLAIESLAFEYTSGSILQIARFPAIDGSGFTSVSSMLDLKLYRDDNVVAGDVLGKEFDIHFQRNVLGSRQEYIK